MRRKVGYELCMLAVVVVLVSGCAESPNSQVVVAESDGEAQYNVDLPDTSESVNLVPGEKDAGTVPHADDSTAATSEKDSAPAKIDDGADSDTPGQYETRTADQADHSKHEHAHPADEKGGDGEKPKRNGRRPDGDDPDAPLIVSKVAEVQLNAPLNDGRAPSAKPIPEGERVASEPKDDAPESFDNGREKGAKPGVERKVEDPASAKPTAKPAAASQPTLADLSESIQELDKDSDGQLGLYEWPREKLAEFKTLDSNQDGFLTPAELVAGQKKASDAASKDATEKTQGRDKEKTSAKPEAKTPPQEEKAPATESDDEPKDKTNDEPKADDSSADGSAEKDGPSAEDKPTQGS